LKLPHSLCIAGGESQHRNGFSWLFVRVKFATQGRVTNRFNEVGFIDAETAVFSIEFELNHRITLANANGFIGTNGDFDLCRIGIHGVESGELVHGCERHAGAASQKQGQEQARSCQGNP